MGSTNLAEPRSGAARLPVWLGTEVVRGLGFWAALRLALPLISAPGGRSAVNAAMHPHPLASLALVLAAAALTHIHMIALRERIFLGNLGIGTERILVAAGAALAAETVLVLLLP